MIEDGVMAPVNVQNPRRLLRYPRLMSRPVASGEIRVVILRSPFAKGQVYVMHIATGCGAIAKARLFTCGQVFSQVMR